jgi:hypothetical protein
VIGILTPLFFICSIACIGWVFLKQARAKGRVSLRTFFVAMSIQLLGFILLNKVFSPQYLVWLLPIAVFLDNRSQLLFAGSIILTWIIFPGYYHELVSLKTHMIAILNIRNFLLVWMLARQVRGLGSF